MCRGTVLVLDDEIAKEIAELLSARDFEGKVATTVEEAQAILEDTWVNWVVVDLCLDTKNQDNIDGEIIIRDKRYTSIPKIVITQYESNHPLIINLLADQPDGTRLVKHYINKLRRQADKNWMHSLRDFLAANDINRKLTIRWSAVTHASFLRLANLLVKDIDSKRIADRFHEIEDLLRLSFDKHEQLTIERVIFQQDGRVYLDISVRDAHGNEERLLLVYGLKEQILQELERYNKYVPKDIAIGYPLVKTLHFAALSYPVTQGALEKTMPGKEWFNRSSIEEVQDTLRNLMQNLDTRWHTRQKKIETISTWSQVYQFLPQQVGFQLSQSELKTKIEALCPKAMRAGIQELAELDCLSDINQLKLRFNHSNSSYPNPVKVLFDESRKLDKRTALHIGTIHGSLQLENILIDHQGQSWPINFAQVTPQAAVLFDDASLEASIKFNLFANGRLQTWYEVEHRLAEATDWDTQIELEDLDFEAQKAIRAICTIRKEAAINKHSYETYRIILAWHAINHLATYSLEIQYSRRELTFYFCYLLSAAMYSNKIEPTVTMKEIKIDERARTITYDGKEYSMPSETDSVLLLYLYQYRNQFCTHKDILLNCWSSPTDDVSNPAWVESSGKGTIAASIARLRKHFDWSADAPIINKARLGYKLECK